jgi:hypothetical protein
MLSFLLVSFALQCKGGQFNFNLLNMNTPDQSRLEQTYANAYGFTPAQVSPVMMAPAAEVPSILQIAKSAATMPLSIFAMRKLGFSYMDILKMYTLPSTTLFSPNVPYDQFGPTLAPVVQLQKTYGATPPISVGLADPLIIQFGQIKLFTDYLRVPYTRILSLPTLDPIYFPRLVVSPWTPLTALLAPTQVVRTGYWLPPGQAKKLGLWEPPGQAKKHWKGGDDDDGGDHGHGHGHGKWK